jgi:hypothetical protein
MVDVVDGGVDIEGGLLRLPREHPLARTHRQENADRNTTIRLDMVNTSNNARVEWQDRNFLGNRL